MPDGDRRVSNPEWRDVLLGTHPELHRTRRIMRRIPSAPRCKMCLAPQAGVGAPVVRLFGYGRYPRNPQICNSCYRQSQRHPGGAEIEITALFADVRGSTHMAERMSPAEFSAAVDSYLKLASRVIRAPGGIVDKLLGDGVMALFMPGFVGEDYALKAVEAAREILAGVALPVGIGLHTGTAWVGFVGDLDGVMDFTALGDAVNVASRLGSEAGPGELLMSEATARAAGTDTGLLEPRRLELRGRAQPLDAFAQRIGSPPVA